MGGGIVHALVLGNCCFTVILSLLLFGNSCRWTHDNLLICGCLTEWQILWFLLVQYYNSVAFNRNHHSLRYHSLESEDLPNQILPKPSIHERLTLEAEYRWKILRILLWRLLYLPSKIKNTSTPNRLRFLTLFRLMSMVQWAEWIFSGIHYSVKVCVWSEQHIVVMALLPISSLWVLIIIHILNPVMRNPIC